MIFFLEAALFEQSLFFFLLFRFEKKTGPIMGGRNNVVLLFYFYFGRWCLLKYENNFQAQLIKKVKDILPGCVVIKMDANYLQGLPDLLILYGSRWAALECKRSASASHRPNQEYYIDIFNNMSFARFIYPENEKEVLNELQQAFRT